MSSIVLDSVSVEFLLKNDSRIGFMAGKKPFKALDNISFKFSDGDQVGILGHNGAGKTTLLRVISGVLPATSGSVAVDGSLQVALSLSTGLLNQASCLENITLRAYQYGFKGEGVSEYVNKVRALVDLEEFIYQPLKTLSNGMRSRLMIAMFLMKKKSIVVLDEWVGVLDRVQLDGVTSLYRLIDSSDIAIVASHNTGFIRKYCNRCLVLDSGRIAYDGETELAIRFYNDLNKS